MTRVDDGGVVGGVSSVEGFFVMLLVEFVGIQVDREASFFLCRRSS